jgi:regulator of protease activity HflC (stomatin/prohibitin superfamily)
LVFILNQRNLPVARGIKVSLVETKQVDLDTEMQRAIARQAEAEREKSWARSDNFVY